MLSISMQNVSVSQKKVKNYLSYERRNLQLCYQPSYEIENCVNIFYNNVCSVAKKWKAIVNNKNVHGCDIVILAET